MILALLFAEFFKIGLFSVGGGLATLPFLYQLADTYAWVSYETIADMVAIAESTPGAIGVNMATYTGFQLAGIPGALTATLGLVTPSIAVILIVARVLQSFKENVLVKAVFSGLRPAAAGLIAAAGFGVLRLFLYNGDAPVWYSLIRWREAAIFAALFFLIRRFKKHPIVYIAAAGLTGIVLGL
ncbi:MAG: chromate transporter [Spirochaetaceae bacterium]|jgi:chromate transporter|nr:chromate transporter [Spirochaetaceae bacterium]